MTHNFGFQAAKAAIMRFPSDGVALALRVPRQHVPPPHALQQQVRDILQASAWQPKDKIINIEKIRQKKKTKLKCILKKKT